MKQINSISELRTISVSDLSLFKGYFEKGNQLGWCYYFPFIYFFSLGKNKQVLFCEDSGSLCLFLLRNKKPTSRESHLSLFFPPVPLNPTALRNSINLVNEFNGEQSARVIWIDEKDAHQIERIEKLDLDVQYREEEYLYDPQLYRELSGTKFRSVRQNLNRIQKKYNPEVKSYEIKYADQCLALLDKWQSSQEKKHEGFEDIVYTKHCLRRADKFESPDLIGKIIFLDNEIKSFGFVGHMQNDVCNFFIGKSDHSITGLNYFLQHQLMLSLEKYGLVNNASDLGHPGLRHAKRSLRPVGMHKMYSAKQTKRINTKSHNHTGTTKVFAKKRKQPEFLNNALVGLREISVNDLEIYKEALAKSPQKTWHNYFPFLLSLSGSVSRSILIGWEDESLCIYLLYHGKGKNSLHLYLPPMPTKSSVIEKCFERLNRYNGDFKGQLYWLPESLKVEIISNNWLQVKLREDEIVYSPTNYSNIDGDNYRILRKHLRRVQKDCVVEVSLYQSKDQNECIELLEKWQDNLGAKNIKVESYHYTKICMALFDEFVAKDLSGIVVRIDGRICSFAFGGEIIGKTACSFINIVDPKCPSLEYFTQYHFLLSMHGYSSINDSTAIEVSELDLIKKALVPIRIEKVYRAIQTKNVIHNKVDVVNIEDCDPVERIESILSNEIIKDLKVLSRNDQSLFLHYTRIGKQKSWCHYFPFLYIFGQVKSRTLLWEVYRKSICLYYLKENKDRVRLHLFVPPFPFNAETLVYAINKVNLFNQDKKGKIIWIEAKESIEVSNLNFTLLYKESEYIFNREGYDNLAGLKLERLVNSVKTKFNVENVLVRKYQKTDRRECLSVLWEWREKQLSEGKSIEGYYYKKASIHNANKFKDGLLRGEVILFDGKIQGAIFGGEIAKDDVSIFSFINSPNFPELSDILKISLTSQFDSANYFNHSSDSEHKDVFYSKQIFQPSDVRLLYGATQAREKRPTKLKQLVKDTNTNIFINAALDLNLDVEIVSESYSYCVISRNLKEMSVYHNTTSLTNVAVRKMTHNKYLSQSILDANDIPVPESRSFYPEQENKIIDYIKQIEPVVIKPVKGSRSVGLTVNPKTSDDIWEAVMKIDYGKVLIERLLEGNDYRVLIYDGQIIDILQWVPPYVIGDAIGSIQELVDQKNDYWDDHDMYSIEIDLEFLQQKQLDIEDVPKVGERVYVHYSNEHYLGGEPVRIDVSDVHQDNTQMFIKAAKVSGLIFAGLDFMSKDINISYKDNDGAINEINSAPHIWPHYFADQGEDLSAVKSIFERFFK